MILIASAAWLIGAGLLMALSPERALRLLQRTASTHRVNAIEQGLRMLAGAALVVRSDASRMPALLEIGGWFVLLSSLLLLVMPLRWHAAYANWWSRKLRPWAVRTIAPFSIAAGAALLYVSG